MKALALALALAAASACPVFAQNPEVPASLERLEAKWRGVMTKIRGWNDAALQQFRDGYKDYPPAVIEKALAARTFEKMLAVLDAHAAVRSQEAMTKAVKVYSMAETLPEDADNAQIAEAKALVAKSLGDDARDLVFIPITPCTVWDTRFATNPASMGIINNATTKRFYSHLDGAGGSYAAYGGNTSCPETAQNAIGPRPFAVMMTVYVNDASANGWLTLYRDGDPDPSFATISVYYSAGPTRTQTVISKSSRGYGSGTYDIAATSRFGNVNASASITGYFVKVTDSVVTNVTASAPLASTGGATPNVAFTTPPANTVLVGNGGAPSFSGNPAISGDLFLVPGTPEQGKIMREGLPFLHATGFASIYLGTAAGNLASTGVENTAVGAGALPLNTTGVTNTAIGRGSMGNSSTASNHTALGGYALANSNGIDNVAVGAYAMLASTSGQRNSVVGNMALQNNSTGNANAVLGWSAMTSNNNGSGNVAVGTAALYSNVFGHDNVAVGLSAMESAAGGGGNVAVGAGALLAVSGSSNIGIGPSAGSSLGAGHNNIMIGNGGAGADTATIRIGSAQTRTFVSGIRSVTTGVANAINVMIDGAGQLGTASSSAAAKDDIADMSAASSDLMKLRPVTFHYKQYGPESPLQYGLIAEEVEKVYPGLVAKRDDGSAETVMYQFLPPMMLNEMQKQQRTIEALTAEVAELKRLLMEVRR